MKIYCAGKISKNDWRDSLIHSRRGSDFDLTNKWPEIEISSGDIYVGPYFSPGCDHGCTHGDNSHGWNEIGCVTDYGVPDVKTTTFHKCLDAINRCDIFFAWIDTKDCYGTLVEIGFAKALGKRICIYTPYNFDSSDLWFAMQCQSRGLSSSPLKSVYHCLNVLHHEF